MLKPGINGFGKLEFFILASWLWYFSSVKLETISSMLNPL